MFQFNFYCLKKMLLDLQRKMTLLFHRILNTNKNNPLWQSQHLKWINKHDAFSSLFFLSKWGLKIVFLLLGWKSVLVGPNLFAPCRIHSFCQNTRDRCFHPEWSNGDLVFLDSSSLSQLYCFLVLFLHFGGYWPITESVSVFLVIWGTLLL